jgi:hypothetical protein
MDRTISRSWEFLVFDLTCSRPEVFRSDWKQLLEKLLITLDLLGLEPDPNKDGSLADLFGFFCG